MKKHGKLSPKLLPLLLSLILTCLITSTAWAAEAHSHTYRLASDSYEATETEGGLRHYACTECGAEYQYTTDPMVYTKNPKTGEPLTQTTAINPYLPGYEYLPDNELHVFWSREDNEWRVYAVGSHDSSSYFSWCGPDVVCWSAPVYDLSDWRYEGILRENDGIYFACDFDYDLQTDQVILYAFPFIGNPEMMPGGTKLWTNGHSVPDSFFDMPLNEAGVQGIDSAFIFELMDPAIYIDDDGTILTIHDASNDDDDIKWSELARVSDDRTEVLWSTSVKMADGEFNSNGLNPKNFEGPTIDYIEEYDIWVIQYCYHSDKYDPEKNVDGEQSWRPLAYIYSDPGLSIDDLKDYSGWHWGGIIGDNAGFYRLDLESGTITDHDDPVNAWGNNHGSLVKINGEWYLSNHRHTYTVRARQGFIEKINMSYENGKLTIQPTEVTSSIGESIDAFHTWPAYISCHLWPSSFTENKTPTLYIDSPGHLNGAGYWDSIYDNPEYASHRTPIVGIENGAEVGFKYLNFGESDSTVSLAVLVSKETGYVDGVMNVFIDAPSVKEGGTQIGSIEISNAAVSSAKTTVISSDCSEWKSLTAKMDKQVSGIHGVFFVFASQSKGNICKLDAFAFSKSGQAQLQTSSNTDGVVIYFVDIARNSKYAKAISNLVAEGVVKGIGDGTFQPSTTVTNAELTAFLGRMENVSVNNDKNWYSSYMTWAKTSGLIADDAQVTPLSVAQANEILAAYCNSKSIQVVTAASASRGDVIVALDAIRTAISSK